MAKRNIVWTKTADIQFVGILEYWVKHNKSSKYSKKLVKLVNLRTNQIAKNPLIYKSTDFQNTRAASMGNFTIFYKVTENDVIVTAFWDNRQDPKKLLKALKDQE